MTRIKRLEIRGFRAFGANAQFLEFKGPMAIIWGPNSQGKTSIAEAIEFLLTGKTVRRELLASAKREFAEALRNAHLPEGEEVIISATIEDANGQLHVVKRRLIRDYTGRESCQSELTIDDVPASDLSLLGIHLSQPPLEAPVLMPHTLRYVVSADPQERTNYFKALLEISDLEEVRTAIANVGRELVPPSRPIKELYDRCCSHPVFANILLGLEVTAPSAKEIAEVLCNALKVITSEIGITTQGLEEHLEAAEQLLMKKRSATFPVDALKLGKAPAWVEPEEDKWHVLEKFVKLKSLVDKEVARLARLFEELLNIPEISKATTPIDCPICKTPKALTPERIEAIRRELQNNTEFRNARQDAETILRNLSDLVVHIESEALKCSPLFLHWDDAERARRGFCEEKLESLLGDQALIKPWRDAHMLLNSSLKTLTRQASELKERLRSLRIDNLDSVTVKQLRQQISLFFQKVKQFVEVLNIYKEKSTPLIEKIYTEVDRRARTEGWQDLIDLAKRQQELLNYLIEKTVYDKLRLDVEEAIEQIDQAKAQVLDYKFTQLSQEILRWWNLLRPNESTSFDGIRRRGTGRRFIDLKARLAVRPDHTNGSVLRDAVAVFSDSQLNCLGLAAFLARTVREETGFVILDDPVPASDEEHRAFFIDNVLNELMNSGIQVILLTHDERMWKDVQERYKHLNIDSFIVTLEDTSIGAKIENRGDTLDALLAKAAQYIQNSDPEIREIGAKRLRDAAERFCKLMLVKDRKSKGDSTANVSDYDGKTLGQLIPWVEPLLTRDRSHPGKLRLIGQRLNPGAHDHIVPPVGDLKQCLGDLRYLRKEYLP